MKTATIIAALFASGLCLPGRAQLEAEPPGQMAEQRLAEILTQRETIIARNLPMTENQRAAFWPVYRKYRAERDEVDNRATRLAADFEKNFDNITDEFSRKLVRAMLEVQRADLAVKTNYLRSFEKVLTPSKAAKFYQIENKLDATLHYYRAQRVPLMR